MSPLQPEPRRLVSPTLEQVLLDLARPAAYAPARLERVDVVQTHISAVFLAGDRVFKVKKPVDLGFVDYSTVERRRACCDAEVELNRRLAPDVYLGVVPVTRGPDGRLRMGGSAEDALEWAVEMRRLPDAERLNDLVARDALPEGLLERLGRHLAAFHTGARRGDDVARWAALSEVARNCRDNLAVVRSMAGRVASDAVLGELDRRTDEALSDLGPTIAARAASACDGHGDLRLEHVYVRGDELRIIDCVEFSESLRCCDPVSDVAFLSMELARAGRRDLADRFARAWLETTRDAGAARLLPFYTAYRAMVRAKVDGLTGGALEVPQAQRERVIARARGHALLALGELAPPRQRPGLVLLTGLPGTGKSVLARALAEAADLVWVRADEVRKALGRETAVSPGSSGAWCEGLYSPAWTERTYARCEELARTAWFEGRRVVLDACFASEARRTTFLTAALAHGVRAVVLHLEAPADVARARLDQRTGDPSDADRSTHERMAAAWEPFGPATARVVHRLRAGGSASATLEQALTALTAVGLMGA